MKKIIVIGCPGSGKSYFSNKLAKFVNIQLFHLDMLYWNEDKTMVSKDIFDERLDDVLNKDKYLIDGNYLRTMEKRIANADTIFFLDFSTQVCVEGIQKRIGQKHSDFPWVEENIDFELLDKVLKFNDEQRPIIVSLLEKYSNKNIIIFKNRVEMDDYLNAKM